MSSFTKCPVWSCHCENRIYCLQFIVSILLSPSEYTSYAHLIISVSKEVYRCQEIRETVKINSPVSCVDFFMTSFFNNFSFSLLKSLSSLEDTSC